MHHLLDPGSIPKKPSWSYTWTFCISAWKAAPPTFSHGQATASCFSVLNHHRSHCGPRVLTSSPLPSWQLVYFHVWLLNGSLPSIFRYFLAVACGILGPHQGSNLPSCDGSRVLTTGPQGKSQSPKSVFFLNLDNFSRSLYWICYSTASVVCFGFLGTREVES